MRSIGSMALRHSRRVREANDVCGAASHRMAHLWRQGSGVAVPAPHGRAACGESLQLWRAVAMPPRRWRGWSIGFVAGSALCLGLLPRRALPPLLLNLSASLPRGLYRVQTGLALHHGMVVVVAPSAVLEAWLVERGYLPHGVLLL